MSLSLFRRWRSQKFSHLVGQESVVSTLQNVLKAGDPARAYLFCGPRGTGKTSSARIFAKALNCERGPSGEPCNECTQCRSISDGNNLDVFEIDAASHTQVDKIRDFIVEKVHFTPVTAKYKVYIIDEVHKLSTSSFNALLKTLEEPPPHVVFILATTHPHEMPSTILSRCQRYDFRPITASETESHLRMIAAKEEISLEEDAARQLARAADGSLRDALVLFEQAYVFADGKVTRESVLDLLGGVGYEVLEEMFADLQRGEAAKALERLDEWIVRGRDLKRLAESFQDHLRMMLLLKVKSEDQSIRHLSSEEKASLERLTQVLSVGAITQWLRSVGEMLAQIRHGRRARLEWELLLVSLAHPETDPSLEGLERRIERVEAAGPVSSHTSASIDPNLLKRLEALESQPAAVEDDPRIKDLERQLARLSHELDNLVARQESETPETEEAVVEPPEVVKQAEPVAAKEEVVTAKLQADEGPLQGDVVDQWLTMPEVLVTGRVSRTGQTSLLDDLGNEAPAREPEVSRSSTPPPEPKPEPGPEPSREAKSETAKAPEELKESPAPEQVVATPNAEVELPDPKEFFRLLMQNVKEQDIRLHAVLADARLTELNHSKFELSLPVGYDWHFGKIQEGKKLLEEVARSLVAELSLEMECCIGGEKAAPPKENEHEELVKRASGVFGGSSIID